jgi:phenylacetate-CoA ligase
VDFQPANLVKKPESFQKIPPLSKAYIRDHRGQFITTDPARLKFAYRSATSGSTGEPLIFLIDRHVRQHTAANTIRHCTWSGWKIGQPTLYLMMGSSPRHLKRKKNKVRAYIIDFAWNSTNVRAQELYEEEMTELASLIRKNKPRLMYVFPASLYFFAQFVRRKGWDDIKVPAVYSAGEVLFPHQRKYFEETFGCEVFNKYAANEVSAIACECKAHNAMHISTETNYVEILDDNGMPVNNGSTGNVTATCLTNYVFPLIRYRLEDVGRMSTRQCSCGRAQPMLEVVEGRLVDAFKTKDGRMVWGECLNIFSRERVKQWQMIQKSMELILVRLVPYKNFRKSRLNVIRRRLKSTMGKDTRVKFEYHKSIPMELGKKFRYIISEVTNPQKKIITKGS